jgi:hypothetical protein
MVDSYLHVSSLSEPVLYSTLPWLDMTIGSAAATGRLAALNVVGLFPLTPMHRVNYPDNTGSDGVGSMDMDTWGGIALFSVSGHPTQDGHLTVNLSCNGSATTPLRVAVTALKNQGRLTEPSDVATDIATAIRTEIYANHCFTGTNVPCSDAAPHLAESLDNLVVFIDQAGSAGTRKYVYGGCNFSIDAQDAPGVSVSLQQEPSKSPTLAAALHAHALRSQVRNSLRFADALRTPQRARYTIAGNVGEHSTPEQIEDAIANCLNPRRTLRAIEVTQAIQDWENSVPLYAGKDAVVKVYVESDHPDVPALRVQVEGKPCVDCDYVVLGQLDASAAPDFLPPTLEVSIRELGQGVYLFEVPRSWLTFRGLRLKLLDAGKHDVVCAEPDGHPDCSTEVTLLPMPDGGELSLTPIQIDFVSLPSYVPVDEFNRDALEVSVDEGALQRAYDKAQEMLPISRLVVMPRRKLTIDASEVTSTSDQRSVPG